MRHLPLNLRLVLKEAVEDAVEKSEKQIDSKLEELDATSDVVNAATKLYRAILEFQKAGMAHDLDTELQALVDSLNNIIENPQSYIPRAPEVVELQPKITKK